MAKRVIIVAVGDSSISRVHLLEAISGEEPSEIYESTIFANAQVKVDIMGIPYEFWIWNTASQVEYDRLRPMSYNHADVVLLFFAFDSKQSFSNLAGRWTKEVKQYAPKAKMILIGTRQKHREDGNPDHVTDDEVKAFVSEHMIEACIPCSWETREGIDQVLPAAAKAVSNESDAKCQVY
jgi:small GTP-binding protein